MSEVCECEELGFVITGIRPATNSLDVTTPTNATNSTTDTVNNATKLITPIPDFSFTDITPAITIDFPTTTSPTTTPKSSLNSSPTSTYNTLSSNHFNPVYSHNLDSDSQFPLNPTSTKPSHFISLNSSPTSDTDSDFGADANADQSKIAKNPINTSSTSTSSARTPLVEGYDSDSSGSSIERSRIRVRKKKRRVRFCEKVSVYIIPNNTANKLREAQGEFEDLVDSMGSATPPAISDNTMDTLDPLASLPTADPDLASDLAAFERDIATVEASQVEDIGLVDAEEVERFDDAVQRDLESRVAKLRNKLKRKRDDVHDTSSPPPSLSPTTLPDLLDITTGTANGINSGAESPPTSNNDHVDDIESDLLISLAKKPRLINCHM